MEVSIAYVVLVEVGVLCGGEHSICRGGCAVWRWA